VIERTRTSPDVTAEHVRSLVKASGKTWWRSHACSLCGVDVGYVFNGEWVSYQASCGCRREPNSMRDWQNVADAINIQPREDVFQRMLAELSEGTHK
jgi:hypothetical protein